MKRYTQVSVFTDNRPGTLARITDALARRGVNVIGFAAWGEVDHGVIRMVVEQPIEALHVLGEAGLPSTEATVLGLELPNVPGATHAVAAALARKKVNIDYCYGADRADGGMLFLRVDDLKGAEAALKRAFPARAPARARRR